MFKQFVLPVLFMCSTFISYSQVRITEIMYNPPESGTDSLEFLELYNAGNTAVNLEGWSFPEGISHVFDNQQLAPGEYLVLCVNLPAFSNTFGSGIRALAWTSGAFNNGGEPLSLVNNQGQVVFRVVYSNAAGGWYSEADGNGASLELCNTNGDPNDVRKWRPSTNGTGINVNGKQILATPGSPNAKVCDDVADVDILVGDFFFDPADITIDVGQTVRWTNTSGTHNVNGSQATFPFNPAGFSSGAPSSGNWMYSYRFDIPGLYRYQCDPHGSMQGTVTVRGNVDPYPLYSIGEVRGINQDGVADSTGVSCSLAGIVHGINQRNIGVQMTLIDADGDGIGLFANADLPGLTLAEGDSIKVWGTIGQFRGLLQMNIIGVERYAENRNLIPSRQVNTLNEESESRLVLMRNMRLVNPAQWTGNPDGFNVDIQNNQGDVFSMRIARNVSIPSPPPSFFDVTGIAGQFSGATAPWLDGYQILPRYESDLNLLVSTRETHGRDFIISVYPNPTEHSTNLTSSSQLEQVTLRTMQGKLLHQWKPGTFTLDIDMTDFPVGCHVLECKTSKGIRSIRIIKIN